MPTATLPAHAYTAVSQFVLHGPGQESWIDLTIAALESTLPWAPQE